MQKPFDSFSTEVSWTLSFVELMTNWKGWERNIQKHAMHLSLISKYNHSWVWWRFYPGSQKTNHMTGLSWCEAQGLWRSRDGFTWSLPGALTVPLPYSTSASLFTRPLSVDCQKTGWQSFITAVQKYTSHERNEQKVSAYELKRIVFQDVIPLRSFRFNTRILRFLRDTVEIIEARQWYPMSYHCWSGACVCQRQYVFNVSVHSFD